MNGSQGSQVLSVHGMVPESSTNAIRATAVPDGLLRPRLGVSGRIGMAYDSVLGCHPKPAELGGPARTISVVDIEIPTGCGGFSR